MLKKLEYNKKLVFVLFLSIICGPIHATSLEGIFGKALPEDKLVGASRLWSDNDVDNLVGMDLKKIYSPLSGPAAAAPDQCDSIQFLRFKLKDAIRDPADADAVLLVMPGIYEGANAFEYIARQMIYVAKTYYEKDFEVWAVDRRSNCLEDLAGFQAAEEVSTADEAMDVMLDYYYEQQPIDGKTFEGFLKPKDIPFVAHFGLALATEDMFTIMEHMIPDRTVRKKKLFVGGHSLGGTHTSVFSAWDKDGNPETTEDAGFNNIAGVFALDAFVTPISEVTESAMDSMSIPESLSNSFAKFGYQSLVAGFESGFLPPVLPVLLDGEVSALPEALGILAHKAPDAESVVLKHMPQSQNLKLMLQLYHSRRLSDFLKGVSILNYRYTNEALLGLIFDDNSSPISFLQASIGFAHGGKIGSKSFPIPYQVSSIPVLGDLVSSISSADPKFIPTDQGFKFFGRKFPGPLYSWASYDEVASPEYPLFQSETGRTTLTQTKDEMVDISDFTRALYIGESNLTEWYFPLRLFVDIMAVDYPYAPEFGINILHAGAVKDLPKIEFIAENGPFASQLSSTVSTEGVRILEGMNHLDPMFAVANAPEQYKNQVIEPLIDWVLNNL